LQSYELQCLTLVFLYGHWIWINSNPDSYPGFRLRISAQVFGVLSHIIRGFTALLGASGTVSAPFRTPIPLPLASFPVLLQLIHTFEDAPNLVWIKSADFFRVSAVYIIDISKRFLRVIWQFIASTVTEIGSRRPRGLRSGSVATRLLELRVRILPVAWMSLLWVLYVVQGRGLCESLITCPEESYRHVVFLSVILKPLMLGGPDLLRADASWGERSEIVFRIQSETTYLVSEFCSPFLRYFWEQFYRLNLRWHSLEHRAGTCVNV